MVRQRWALVMLAAACLCATTTAHGVRDWHTVGTAFAVTPDGYLLTCAHVVKGAGEVRVCLKSTEYKAAVLAMDEKTDLALLKVETTALSPVRLGGATTPQAGGRVWTLGFPMSSVLGETVKVTGGTVSGVGVQGTQQVIQTDAAVNPGNSGGPLVDEFGAVVGVVNAKLTGEAVSNVGFAVPISYARALLGQQGVPVAGPADGGDGRPGAAARQARVLRLDGPAVVRLLTPSVASVSVRVSGAVALRTFTVARGASSVALSPDGATLASPDMLLRQVRLWDVATGELVRTLSVVESETAAATPMAHDLFRNAILTEVVFSPGGGELYGGMPLFGLVRWSLSTQGGGVGTGGGHGGGLAGPGFCAFSLDGKWLIHGVGMTGDTAEVMDRRTLEQRQLGDGCSAVAISPDSRLAALAYSSSASGVDSGPRPAPGVQMVEIATGDVVRTLNARTAGVHSVSFSPDGRYLAVEDSDKGVSIAAVWDLQSGEVARTLNWGGARPDGVCFAPAGHVLAVTYRRTTEGMAETDEASTPGEDTTVLWDTRTWTPAMAIPGPMATWGDRAFSRDGKRLVLWRERGKSVTVWDVDTE